MIFGDGLERDAPPKIPVDLNVPFVPPGIGGIAPAFFLQQLKDGTKQVVTVPAFFVPKNSATQTAGETGAIRQMFVHSNHASRRAFEMQPGEITRPPSDERLGESEDHHEEPCVHRIEFRFDWRPHHVRKCDAESAAQHEIRHDTQSRQENPEPKKKNRQREPFNTAEVSGDFRLRPGINRLKESFAENSMIDHRPVDEPAKARRPVDLTAPFRGAGRTKKNQVFETKQRLGFAIPILLL